MHTCRDCIHARWELSPTGRIKRGSAGLCSKEFEVADIKLPVCITASFYRVFIWPDCPAAQCPGFLLKTSKDYQPITGAEPGLGFF